jgi:hypothetical protein
MIDLIKLTEIPRDEFFQEFLTIQKVGFQNFAIYHADKDKLFDVFLNEAFKHLSDWIETFKNKTAFDFHIQHPNYGFIHYIAQSMFPLDYDYEIYSDTTHEHHIFLKHIGINKHNYLEIDDKNNAINFCDTYNDVIVDIFDFNFEQETTKLINSKQLLNQYKGKSIRNYDRALVYWEDTICNEFILIVSATLMAVSRTVYKKINNESD